VTGRSRREAAIALAAGLVCVLGLPAPPAPAAAPRLSAGAAAVEVSLPPGTPLGGYGGFPRRAWFPDVLGRVPEAFWFRPAAGVHDPFRVRALVLEAGTTRLLWLAVDLVGVDPGLVTALTTRLARDGRRYTATIVSASHTHSGPGAYAESALFGFVALDRLSPRVRGALLDGLDRAAREAERLKRPARVGTGRAEVTGVARSRLEAPLDPELGVLKVVGVDGRPLAMVWNYAIHGTALGRDNFLLSGDLMAEAAARIERALGAPSLFVNGAVADVSPEGRGWAGVRTAGERLAAGALAAWSSAGFDPDPALEVAIGRLALPPPSLSPRNCLGRWLPAGLAVGLRDALPASGDLIAVRIGTAGWVTIPGELQTRLGLEVKAAGRGAVRHVFVAGVSNNYLGYFLTPADYARPSYIACGSLYGPRGGEIMRDAAIAALRRLGARAERR
jgi:hypothetical protein